MSRRSPDWLLDQLPVGMVQEDFFRRFVSIFQEVATSYLELADGMEHVVDPAVAPAPVLPWLGTWLGTNVIDPDLGVKAHEDLGVDVQRRLVRAAGRTLAWRGTRRGVTEWLQAITGGPVLIDDPGGVYREGEAPVRAPIVRITVRSTGWMPEDEFVELVRSELPAHVGLELHVGDRLVASPQLLAEGGDADAPTPPDRPEWPDPTERPDA